LHSCTTSIPKRVSPPCFGSARLAGRGRVDVGRRQRHRELPFRQLGLELGRARLEVGPQLAGLRFLALDQAGRTAHDPAAVVDDRPGEQRRAGLFHVLSHVEPEGSRQVHAEMRVHVGEHRLACLGAAPRRDAQQHRAARPDQVSAIHPASVDGRWLYRQRPRAPHPGRTVVQRRS
jgi:hypothetical protein